MGGLSMVGLALKTSVYTSSVLDLGLSVLLAAGLFSYALLVSALVVGLGLLLFSRGEVGQDLLADGVVAESPELSFGALEVAGGNSLAETGPDLDDLLGAVEGAPGFPLPVGGLELDTQADVLLDILGAEGVLGHRVDGVGVLDGGPQAGVGDIPLPRRDGGLRHDEGRGGLALVGGGDPPQAGSGLEALEEGLELSAGHNLLLSVGRAVRLAAVGVSVDGAHCGGRGSTGGEKRGLAREIWPEVLAQRSRMPWFEFALRNQCDNTV